MGPRILNRLDIGSMGVIMQRFGKAGKVEQANPFHIYTFADGHIRVIWSDGDKRITTVNVVE